MSKINLLVSIEDNKESITTLLRTIIYFQGSFSLSVVCCNVPPLGLMFLQELRDRSSLEYQELTLEPTTKSLHQAILNTIQGQQPKALIVTAIESVVAIDYLLAGANQVRDQFSKDFDFPLILWMTDELLIKFKRSAPHLASWASVPIQINVRKAEGIRSGGSEKPTYL
jgi:hypothetical protein